MNHVALNVSDLERSRAFYVDILGFEIMNYTEHNDGAISVVWNTPHVFMKEYRLRPPAMLGYGPRQSDYTFTLDLIQWTSPTVESYTPKFNQVPAAHFCFTVQDLAKSVRDLENKGVEFIAPPYRFPEEEGSWHVVFFKDPDGVVLEFLEARPDWVGSGV
jgi:catechol 2,3-dioxygenase-like lactoylglutathione lyase family enzyme